MMQQEWCNKNDATRMMQQEWCSKNDAARMMQQEWCRKNDAARMMQQEWCSKNDAARMMQQEWCSKNDAARMMQQYILNVEKHIYYCFWKLANPNRVLTKPPSKKEECREQPQWNHQAHQAGVLNLWNAYPPPHFSGVLLLETSAANNPGRYVIKLPCAEHYC